MKVSDTPTAPGSTCEKFFHAALDSIDGSGHETKDALVERQQTKIQQLSAQLEATIKEKEEAKKAKQALEAKAEEDSVSYFCTVLKYQLIGSFSIYSAIAKGEVYRKKETLEKAMDAGLKLAVSQINNVHARAAASVLVPMLWDKIKNKYHLKKIKKIAAFYSRYDNQIDEFDRFLNEVTQAIGSSYARQLVKLKRPGIDDLARTLSDIITDYISEHYLSDIRPLHQRWITQRSQDPQYLTPTELVYRGIMDWDPTGYWYKAAHKEIATIDSDNHWYAEGIIAKTGITQANGSLCHKGVEQKKYGCRDLLPGEMEYRFTSHERSTPSKSKFFSSSGRPQPAATAIEMQPSAAGDSELQEKLLPAPAEEEQGQVDKKKCCCNIM